MTTEKGYLIAAKIANSHVETLKLAKKRDEIWDKMPKLGSKTLLGLDMDSKWGKRFDTLGDRMDKEKERRRKLIEQYMKAEEIEV